MNKTIKELRKKINQNNKVSSELMESLRLEYYKIFDDSQLIRELINTVENSTDYGRGESWPYWPCIYLYTDSYPELKHDSESWEFLKDYLSENYYIHVEGIGESWEYYSLSLGPCILIDSDSGNVYDQETDKKIIIGSEYSSEKERNQLIENSMASAGAYPAVFIIDRDGNIVSGPINTDKKGKWGK